MHLRAILITIFGVLLMSIETLFMKITSIDALTFAFYIGIFMFLSLNIILLTTLKKKTIFIYKVNIQAILICGALSGVSIVFFISAIKTTTVANTVFILASAPLFSAFYSYLLYKEKSKKNIYIVSFFIFVGLTVIFFSQLGSGDMKGNIYALVSANLFSLYFVVLSKYNEANRFAIIAFGGLIIATISFFLANNLLVDMNTLMILLLAGLLVVPISRVLISLGTKQLPASEVSLLMTLEAVAAPFFVWLILREVPSDGTFTGGFIIILSLFVNSLYLLKVSKNT
ncbi:DMT family transporter [Arcobacter sp.]|uniref:DMT family transporter n=1 Tax=Arcobacter sp. TaxID=1872629 RepID=UPI003C766526